MKKLLRFLGFGALGLLGLVILAAAAVHGLGARILDRTYEVTDVSIVVPDDSASVAEGERRARILGCADSCHGDGVGGQVFFEDPIFGRANAPDLAHLASIYTDAELERAIRQGVRPDGTSTLIMPSSMFHWLTDQDLARLLAFIRSQPTDTELESEVVLRPPARFFILRGVFEPQRVTIESLPPRTIPDPEDPVSLGRYLALTACTECHDHDLGGSEDGSTPDLRQVLAYDREAFQTLLTTGVGLGDRDLGLMSGVAENRFAHFTDAERDALYDFLRARAEGSAPTYPES